jgi:hypothetical protein
MPTTVYSGKTGSVSIGGSAQPLTDWSLEISSEPVDITNFTSQGYEENMSGITRANITCSGPYDGLISANIGDAGGLVTAFILSTGTTLGASPTTGPSFTINGRVTSVSISQNVRGVAMVNITAQSNGVLSITP